MQFLLVYIREAHALDGDWPMGGDGRGPIVEDPETFQERREVAHRCDEALDIDPIPILVDDIEDTAERAYSGWPDRIYLVGEDGRIAYAGDRGPRGFEPAELEAAIREELGLPDEEAEGSGPR